MLVGVCVCEDCGIVHMVPYTYGSACSVCVCVYRSRRKSQIDPVFGVKGGLLVGVRGFGALGGTTTVGLAKLHRHQTRGGCVVDFAVGFGFGLGIGVGWGYRGGMWVRWWDGRESEGWSGER